MSKNYYWLKFCKIMIKNYVYDSCLSMIKFEVIYLIFLIVKKIIIFLIK